MAQTKYAFDLESYKYDKDGNVVKGGHSISIFADSYEEGLAKARTQANRESDIGSYDTFQSLAGNSKVMGKKYVGVVEDSGKRGTPTSVRGVGDDGSLVKKSGYTYEGDAPMSFSKDLSKEYGGLNEVNKFTPQQIANDPTNAPQRNPNESIADFTKRIDSGIITDNVTGNQYILGPEGHYIPYTGQTLPGGAPGALGGALGGVFGSQAPNQGQNTSYTGGTIGAPGTGSIVGTSASERIKQLQKELGVGSAPKVPDYFTTAMEKELALARGDRTAIESELASILNERLAMEEEMQKFAINAGEGTTEAGRIGAVSEAQRNANERLQVLNRRELVLETKLSNRNQVISELMGLQKQEYAEASAQYERNFSRALQLYNIFDEEQDELRTNAKANLDVLSGSIQAQIEAGMIDANNISSSQRRQLQDLEVQAGLPLGSTMAVLSTLKPEEEKIYTSFNEKTGQLQYFYRNTDGTIGVRTSQGSPTSSGTPSDGTGLKDGNLSITAEDSRTLVGAGFSVAEISQIVADVNAYGIDAVLDGVSGSQKAAIQKVFGVTPKVTREQVTASVTQRLAQEGLEDFYTTDELEKLAAKHGFSSIWKSRETEVQEFLNSSKAKEIYVDLLYQQYKTAGQAE